MVDGNTITGGDVQPVTPLECNVGLCLSSESSYLIKKTSFVSNSSPYYRHNHCHRASADEVMRAYGQMVFTATQWQELHMQTMIYNYLMASIPVPHELLLPLSTQFNSLRFSKGSDPEPWRCRRTDGKKWRCSKDVAPGQKYCDHHARKTRSRLRKPVEIELHNTKYYPTMISAANQQTKCREWFMKDAGIPKHQSNNRYEQPMRSPIEGSKRDHSSTQECSLTLNDIGFDHESFQMAAGMLSGDSDGSEDFFIPHHGWLNQASWACLFSGSGSGSTPGGPLSEALCFGITSNHNELSTHGYSYSTTTSSSCGGGGLNFGNRFDD